MIQAVECRFYVFVYVSPPEPKVEIGYETVHGTNSEGNNEK